MLYYYYSAAAGGNPKQCQRPWSLVNFFCFRIYNRGRIPATNLSSRSVNENTTLSRLVHCQAIPSNRTIIVYDNNRAEGKRCIEISLVICHLIFYSRGLLTIFSLVYSLFFILPHDASFVWGYIVNDSDTVVDGYQRVGRKKSLSA
jgi:hypothetical protein